jgi:hypothetical protein
MYRLLIIAVLVATLQEFGGATRMLNECRNLNCVREVAGLSKAAITIKWKPIVIFQREADQFK